MRAFAVACLEGLTDEQLEVYMLQLVQVGGALVVAPFRCRALVVAPFRCRADGVALKGVALAGVAFERCCCAVFLLARRCLSMSPSTILRSPGFCCDGLL